MSYCQINYSNNSNGIYYSGEVITGIIIIDNEESRKIHNISMTFYGHAKVRKFYLNYTVKKCFT